MQAANNEMISILLWEYQSAGEMMEDHHCHFWCNVAKDVMSKSRASWSLDMNDLTLKSQRQKLWKVRI